MQFIRLAVFRSSLPVVPPSLGQAAEVYDRLLEELKQFEAKLKDERVPDSVRA